MDNEDDDLTPEEIRKEIFEQILKRRIFYSDRFEKIEKVLLTFEMIHKDTFYCSDFGLNYFKMFLHANSEQILQTIHKTVLATLDTDDHVWFDIYRQVSGGGPQGGGDTDADRLRQRKLEKRRQRQQRERKEMELRRLKAIHDGYNKRMEARQQSQSRPRRMSDGVIMEERKKERQEANSNVAANQQQVNEVAEVAEINNGLNQMQNMVAGLAAIRYLLDTAIEVVQQRRAQQE